MDANPVTRAAGGAGTRGAEALLQEARSPEDRTRRTAAARLALLRDPRAVPALLGLLADPRQSVQEAAAQALRHRGDVGVAEALAALLGSPDLGLRNRAGTVLTTLGDVAVPVLIREATSGEAGVRKFTIEIMGEIRSPWVVSTLFRGLDDEDENVAFAAAEALGKFPAPEIAERLIEVYERRPEIRCPVADALGNSGDPRAVPVLIGALGEGDLLLRFSAVGALGQIGSPEALRPLMDAFRESPEPLQHAILRSVTRLTEKIPAGDPALRLLASLQDELLLAARADEPEIRRSAIRILSLCEPGRAVLDCFAHALGDPSEEVRQVARRSLEKCGADFVPRLLETLRSGNVEGRLLAAELVGARFDDRAVPGLRTLIPEPDERLRAAAALALGQCAAASDAFELVRLSRDPVAHVRSCAARGLGWLRAAAAAAPLRALLDDEAEEVRESALGALVLLAGPDVVEGFRLDLGHERPERCRLAGVALGFIGDASVVEPLLQALGHGDLSIRKSAALSLGRLMDRRAVEPLRNALGDPEAGVRQAAIEALASLDRAGQFDRLSECLGDPDPWVRYHLVSTLSTGGAGVDAGPLLMAALDDPAPAVVVVAVEALGRQAAAHAVPKLIPLLDRPEQELVRAVTQSLARVGGEEAQAALARHRSAREHPRAA